MYTCYAFEFIKNKYPDYRADELHKQDDNTQSTKRLSL